MKKEDFRDLIIGDTKEEHLQEINEWIENTETEFVRIAEAINWPVEKIRGCYTLFGFRLGLGTEHEGVKNKEQ
ncbi:hypothetical protein [Sphingobacterium faecale]|uniref:Uncharacterized protein n=1 Tax=Sphingobacterium faecale TaxID=2803775 RepID=A0ABS1R8R2_9SPHI|nr:hypothetical protein [Sphingobacterium faecale]MBL1411107.1 hypothetical protein [Sphingobacterium faecale]